MIRSKHFVLMTVLLAALPGCGTTSPHNPSSASAPDREPGTDWYCNASDAEWNCIESSQAPPVRATKQARRVAAIPAPNEHTRASMQEPTGEPIGRPVSQPMSLNQLKAAMDATPSSAELIGRASEVAAAPSAHSSTSSAAIPPPSASNSSEPAGPPRILDQPRDHWAVQLIATESQERLEAFALKHELMDRAAVRLASGNSIRYVLLWNVYPTRAAADAAIAALPKALAELKPFPREIGTIQDAMKAAVEIAKRQQN